MNMKTQLNINLKTIIMIKALVILDKVLKGIIQLLIRVSIIVQYCYSVILSLISLNDNYNINNVNNIITYNLYLKKNFL